MRIEIVSEVTPDSAPELVEAFARLMPQHAHGARLPSAQELYRVAAAPGTTLLIARDEQGGIVGTLTLIVFLTPGATLGYIEDVVVDE